MPCCQCLAAISKAVVFKLGSLGELRIIFRHDLRAFLAFVPATVPPVKFAPCWTGVATSVLVPYKPPRHGKCAAYAGWFRRVSWSRYDQRHLSRWRLAHV